MVGIGCVLVCTFCWSAGWMIPSNEAILAALGVSDHWDGYTAVMALAASKTP